METTDMGKNQLLLDNYKKYYSRGKYNSETTNYLICMIENMLEKIDPKDIGFLENRSTLLNERNAYCILNRFYDKYRYKLFNLQLNYKIELYLKKSNNNDNDNDNSKDNDSKTELFSEREIISRLMLNDVIDIEFLHTDLTFLEDDNYVKYDYNSNED
jgi:hypothetical protein